MNFRKATEENIDVIMGIYDRARDYMRANGNYIQWQNGYPSKEIVLSDIKKEQCYVCLEGERIVAVFSLDYSEESLFSTLSEGEWFNEEPYAVIRRIAVEGDMHNKNMGPRCFEYAFRQACKNKVNNLRLITHKDNIAMLKAMEKFGFKYCGIIDLKDGHPRMAYHFTERVCTMCMF